MPLSSLTNVSRLYFGALNVFAFSLNPLTFLELKKKNQNLLAMYFLMPNIAKLKEH